MTFVLSEDSRVRGFGIGKLVDAESNPGLIQYFVSPADDPVEQQVDPASIKAVELYPQERIFFVDGDRWRIGRLEGYIGRSELGLRLPNQVLHRVLEENAFVRSNLPIQSPLGLLQSRNTETPYWHSGRTTLVHSLAEQRAMYRGLTGLASANIELFEHQFKIAQRVLNDAVPRFLLADEVGLGKTIEAGIVIRQHLLDEPSAAVLVVAPDHLVVQWQEELERLFHIRNKNKLLVVAHSDPRLLSVKGDRLTLLVVDEAHQVAKAAFDQGDAGDRYQAISRLAQQSTGVLVLSATPILHHEDAFLGMLHLVDPAAHSLSNRESFRSRVENREAIAGAVRDLEDDASGLFLEAALDDIQPLADAHPHLSTQLGEVRRLLDEPDSPERQRAIRSLRAVLQESYRLDRRLLRNRRGQEGVRDDLPSRAHKEWRIKDPVRETAFQWIDQWRFAASDSPDREGATEQLLEFVEAGLEHPRHLARAIRSRIQKLETGESPFFEDELQFCIQAPKPQSLAEDVRLLALADLLTANGANGKWVIFCSDPDLADGVASELSKELAVLRLRSDISAAETARRFRRNGDIVAVVCDRLGEEGLNLQGVGAQIVHFDVPLNANRIEQRIGRLDRLGGNLKVTSLIPVIGEPSSSYESAWATCLIEGVRVFERSVASLQHALDEGRRMMVTELVDGGIEALSDLASHWKSADHPLSLEQELRRIESQQVLDSLEALEDSPSDHYEQLEEYEYGGEPSRGEVFSAEIHDWAGHRLHLKGHISPERGNAIEYEHSRRTLLPANRFSALFRNSFGRSRDRRGLSTGWMHCDRSRAEKHGIPIARVGHPFIDDLSRLLETDDRGRAYACWRALPGYAPRDPQTAADLFFRFDFLIEPRVRELLDPLRDAGISRGAFTRRAEEAFPPLFYTAWVDIDGQEVHDPEKLAQLSSTHDSSTDTNLRDLRWEKFDDLGMVADWTALCASVFSEAEKLVEEASELQDRLRESQRHLSARFGVVEANLSARISTIGEAAGDPEALDKERRIFELLSRATTSPRMKLDSAGAIVLANHNPFSE